MDFLIYIGAGAFVGLAIAVTGVGGGSLMTPLLLLFGFPLHMAVGTDLVYAALTKTGAAWSHSARKTIHWDLVILLAAGSVPGAGLTIICLNYLFDSPQDYTSILSMTLGVMLIMTSLAMVFRSKIRAQKISFGTGWKQHHKIITWCTGLVLGVLVTLSSVGAAVIATAALMMMYPRLQSMDIVGTNIAHAVPLTFIAGAGHAYLGNVDYLLLFYLLLGSLPATYVGSRMALLIPDYYLQKILIVILFGVGLKFTFF